MPQNINQPSNQIKLTNVSLVRLKKGKRRFEIACYKNKVLEWRSGTEKDLDNVLQIPQVFLNVSKGQTAPKTELSKAFGTMTTDQIVLEILDKGELQVGEKERQAELERMHAEVIDIVAGKLVDPRTKRVYTSGMIEKALDMLSQNGAKAPDKEGSEEKGLSAHWNGVVTSKSAKSQALDAIKALVTHQPIPVMRARMRLRITCPAAAAKAVRKSDSSGGGTIKERILAALESVEVDETIGEDWEVTGFGEPGALKIISDLLSVETRGAARVEVLETHEGA